eukprot:TRINITY_DN1064_c0_g2_i3.p1 TRINITY_DN1064_c0_g2~~TRINITY_DN1064_c0_g2_i3.p1  ORF type:complete len:328 (-),score=40.48 TRINITY_DN1064_c0_g2_i3:68-1051(-)
MWQTQPTTSTWGQPQTQPTTATSTWGQPQTQPATTSTWGQPQTQPTTSTWGQPQTQTTSTWGQPQTQPQTPYFASGGYQPRPDYLLKLDQIRQHIDRNSKACKFRTLFYTKVDGATKYVKPDCIPDRMWEEAKENNPDPSCLVPVQAVGFLDLQKRAAVQSAESQKHYDIMFKYEQDIQNLKNYYELEITKKIKICKERQRDFEIRLMDVMIKQELSRASGPLTYAEEQWKGQLELLQQELNNPNQFKARLYDLISTVKMKNAASAQADPFGLQSQDVTKIVSFLEEQTKVLTLVTSEMKHSIESLEIMLEKFKEPLPGTEHYYRNK